jgi:phage terminase large subunit GpA-like protein
MTDAITVREDFSASVRDGLVDPELHEVALGDLMTSLGSSWLPPPTTPLDKWMDENFVLVPESSTLPNTQWQTIPYQKGIARSFSDPAVSKVTVHKSARIGYTKLLVGYLGYRIALDPCSMMVVQPSLEDAEGFSSEEFTPMCRDVESIGNKMRTIDKVGKKLFLGGAITIGGAHSGRLFRRLTVDIAALDEVDGYPPSAGGEGDQIELANKRLYTSSFPKLIIGSSPKLKGASRIDDSWELSDQRDYLVPCPYCKLYQRLQWGGRDYDYGIKWPAGKPKDAYYLCEGCHEKIPYGKQRWMVRTALKNPDAEFGWVAKYPERKSHHGHRIWAAYSPFPQATWASIAEEFLRDKDDPMKLQVFVNTTLGQSWEDSYETVNQEGITARCERYTLIPGTTEKDPHYYVPRNVIVMTAGVDVQMNRLEVQIIGHGLDDETWMLRNVVLDGDPTGDAVWDDLWDFLNRPLKLERGGEDYVRSWCIDSGYLVTNVESFLRVRQAYRTKDGARAYGFMSKGMAGVGQMWPREPNRKRKSKIPQFIIHVDAGKELVYARLNRVLEPGPGYIHFPIHPEFNAAYFDQLTAEKVMLTTDKKGYTVREWGLKPGRKRNEALDTFVLALAALEGLVAAGFSLVAHGKVMRIRREPKASRKKQSLPDEEVRIEDVEPRATKKASTQNRRRRARRRVVRSAYLG